MAAYYNKRNKSTGAPQRYDLNARFKEDVEEVDNMHVLVGAHLQPITKSLVVSFRGSLNDLASDPDYATWKISNAQIFDMEQVVDDEESVKKLENAILIAARIKKIQSTYPCELIIDIKDIKAKKYDLRDGTKANYVVYPNEVNINLDEVLLAPSKTLNSDYLINHRKYTPNRLLADVISFPNKACSWVPKKHPVIQMIHDNAEALQMSLSRRDLVNNEFYIVPNDILDECMKRLREELHEKVPLTDLKNFSVTIARPEHKPFSDPDGVCDNVSTDAAISKILNAKRSMSFVLELTYSLV